MCAARSQFPVRWIPASYGGRLSSVDLRIRRSRARPVESLSNPVAWTGGAAEVAGAQSPPRSARRPPVRLRRANYKASPHPSSDTLLASRGRHGQLHFTTKPPARPRGRVLHIEVPEPLHDTRSSVPGGGLSVEHDQRAVRCSDPLEPEDHLSASTRTTTKSSPVRVKFSCSSTCTLKTRGPGSSCAGVARVPRRVSPRPSRRNVRRLGHPQVERWRTSAPPLG